jgi:ATP-binding cassette, subfamily C, bacterial LapB
MLWSLVRPLLPAFHEILVLSVFVNLLALAVPIFVMQVYDRVVFHAALATLQGLVVGVAVVLAFDWVLRQARARLLQRIALRLDVGVGRELFGKLQSLPLATLEKRPAAYWHSLFRDADVARNTLSGGTALMLCDVPFAVFFLMLTLLIAPPVGWVLLVVLSLFALLAWRSANAMSAAGQAERDSGMARDHLITELIAGRSTVKALALDDAVRPLWERCHAECIERAVTRGARADNHSNVATTMTMATTVAMTAIGAAAIMNQQMSIGALIAAGMLSGRLLAVLGQLVAGWRQYAQFQQSVERLADVFALTSDRRCSSVALPRPSGRIDVQDVRFAYDDGGRPVLDGVSLSFVPGGITALVGGNGSGKSTLLKLMQGLYTPAQGRVLLDGADVVQFGRRELARWIGWVPQECTLLVGSVRDNIAYRQPDADDDEIVRAACLAGVHAAVVDLPDGYATDVGEAGRRLSAGQRQRITIARALLGDPPVLLLDEPTASLDLDSVKELSQTLASLAAERTVVVATHSPQLLTACRTVVQLERGGKACAEPAEQALARLLGLGRSAMARPPARPPAGAAA